MAKLWSKERVPHKKFSPLFSSENLSLTGSFSRFQTSHSQDFNKTSRDLRQSMRFKWNLCLLID